MPTSFFVVAGPVPANRAKRDIGVANEKAVVDNRADSNAMAACGRWRAQVPPLRSMGCDNQASIR